MAARLGRVGGLAQRLVLTRVRTSLDREVWTTRLEFLRLAWKELLVAAAVPIVIGIALVLLPLGNPVVRQVVAGGLFATAFWMVYVITAMRTYNVTVGSWAEGWTREVLRHRDLGWAVQDDLFLGSGNIDHIAVTQDEVLVVESKYRGYSRRADRERHARDVEQARKGSARVKADLRRRGLDVAAVVPVLVVWGPGAKDLPRLESLSGTQVVAGQELMRWCRQRSNKRLVSLTQRKAIAAALVARRREHDEWRARQPS